MGELMTASSIGVSLQRRPVLSGVDFSASKGELVAVVGPNGAGKSTLLRILAGLLAPDTGTVRLEGMDIHSLDRHVFARKLAYLPQDHGIHWGVRVADLVALGRLPHRSAVSPLSDTDRRIIAVALETMDIAQFADRSVKELSGGERARVLIARSLAQDPAILLADEPVAGLDAVHQLELFAHLKRLADRGRAVVVVLHDLSLAARFADRLIIMREGRVHASGAPADVLTADILATVYGLEAHLGAVDDIPFVVPLASLRMKPDTDSGHEEYKSGIDHGGQDGPAD